MTELTKLFTKDELRKIVHMIMAQIPAHAKVAVGAADWINFAMGLDYPVMVARSSGEDCLSAEDRRQLEEAIIGAHSDCDGGPVNYDYKTFPVYSYGIKSGEENVGVIFIAIEAKMSADIYFGKKATVDLIEKIEAAISELLPKTDVVAWKYGVLVNHSIFISQDV